MNGQAHREVSDTKFSWRPVASTVLQGQYWLRSSLTSSLTFWMMQNSAECTFRVFAADTNFKGLVDMPAGCAAIQRDHNKLEKWADGKLMKFNKEKCKVLQLGRNNPIYLNRLGTIHLGSSLAERNLQVLVDKVN